MHDTKKFFSIEKNNLILISYSSWFMNDKVVSFGSTFTREKILSVFCYILNNSQFLLWYPRWNRLPERWQHDEVHDDDGEDWDGVAGDEETHVEPDEVVVVDVKGANVGVYKEKTCLIKLISNKCLSDSLLSTWRMLCVSQSGMLERRMRSQVARIRYFTLATVLVVREDTGYTTARNLNMVDINSPLLN